jgi:protein-S-isoprenylcysteine O-methyltransferase Ste14
MISDGSSSPASRSSSGAASILRPYVTVQQVEAAANGATEASIFDAVLAHASRHSEFASLPTARAEFQFKPLSSRRSTFVIVGWPLPIWSHETMAVYDDPFAETGFRPLVTDDTVAVTTEPYHAPAAFDGKALPFSRWVWADGSVQHRPPVEETGGRFEWTYVKFLSMGTLLGLVGCAWCAGALIGFVMDVRRHRARRRPIGRIVRWTCATLAFLAILIGTIATVQTSSLVDEDSRGAGRNRSGEPVPSIPIEELNLRRDDPSRDRWISQKLLELIPKPGSPKWCLAMKVTSDWDRLVAYSQWGERLGLISMTTITVRGPDGSDGFAFPSLQTRWTGSQLGVSMSSDPRVQRTLSLNVRTLGSMVGVAIVLWAGLATIRAAIDRRERRIRERSGRCIACGHQLRATEAAGS